MTYSHLNGTEQSQAVSRGVEGYASRTILVVGRNTTLATMLHAPAYVSPAASTVGSETINNNTPPKPTSSHDAELCSTPPQQPTQADSSSAGELATSNTDPTRLKTTLTQDMPDSSRQKCDHKAKTREAAADSETGQKQRQNCENAASAAAAATLNPPTEKNVPEAVDTEIAVTRLNIHELRVELPTKHSPHAAVVGRDKIATMPAGVAVGMEDTVNVTAVAPPARAGDMDTCHEEQRGDHTIDSGMAGGCDAGSGGSAKQAFSLCRAEEVLKELYEIHDMFFSAHKEEKQVQLVAADPYPKKIRYECSFDFQLVSAVPQTPGKVELYTCTDKAKATAEQLCSLNCSEDNTEK